jgi:hypothetical protein
MMRSGLMLMLCLCLLACSTGEGQGQVVSDNLTAQGCWSGPFNLAPTFFAAESLEAESLIIRVQRGDDIPEVSDGLMVVIYDLPQARSMLGQELPVGLPLGVEPLGAARPAASSVNVSLALYLHSSCRSSNLTLYSTAGSIRFHNLFSGDTNEKNSEARLTSATFSATFEDPRQLGGASGAEPRASTVSGSFEFYFQRGKPAQPF